MGLAAALRATL